MTSVSQDAQLVAGHIARAVAEASDNMHALAARVAEIAALAAALQGRAPTSGDLPSIERIESAAQSALYHMQAHDRLVQDLASACEVLGSPMPGMPRRGRAAVFDAGTDRGSVELF